VFSNTRRLHVVKRNHLHQLCSSFSWSAAASFAREGESLVAVGFVFNRSFITQFVRRHCHFYALTSFHALHLVWRIGYLTTNWHDLGLFWEKFPQPLLVAIVNVSLPYDDWLVWSKSLCLAFIFICCKIFFIAQQDFYNMFFWKIKSYIKMFIWFLSAMKR